MVVLIKNYKFKNKILIFLVGTIDLIGYFLFYFLTLFKKEDLKKSKINKILIIRLDDVGDVVMATPFIRELKRKFKESKIDILVKSSTKDILINNPYINKIITLEPLWMRTDNPVSFFKLVKLIRKLRREKYEVIFELRGNPFNIMLAFFINSKYRISYGSQGFGFLLTHFVEYNPKRKHEIERNLDLLRAFRFKIKSKNPEIYLSKHENSFADDFFKKNKLIGDFTVCIHAGAPWIPKRWPKERFAELSNELIDKYKAKVILVGSKDEISLTNEIINFIIEKNRESVINVAGKTNIRQLAALISKCNLFIGNDSGPGHMASALRVPIIALFGSQDPKIFGPLNKGSFVIYNKKDFHRPIQNKKNICQCGSCPCKGMLKIKTKEVLNTISKEIRK